ncbi:TPM domain-containing protein [Sphingobacterium sp. SRCM116780]|uniref:TPM domain-containing protein n=1 Tax=Sphingobacterium sp. SRCM116780 TaxID=2907623 RepID=UPI001F3599FC|nr:TPM domain-containing protein [Sphingobacterium sp. SRCM116780]UIR56060.1 TPM domain-containing protein [Sphingobacterium sp. SRCM116780]
MEAFSSEEQEKVVHAISVAENRTSGEIRVVIEKHCPGEVFERATHYFEKLGMHQTALRNGVLIYLASEDHKFSIIGDAGINKRVADDFWESTKEIMVQEFRNGQFVTGLTKGIEHAAEQLAKFYPRQHDDINELPNDIVFGDN